MNIIIISRYHKTYYVHLKIKNLKKTKLKNNKIKKLKNNETFTVITILTRYKGLSLYVMNNVVIKVSFICIHICSHLFIMITHVLRIIKN